MQKISLFLLPIFILGTSFINGGNSLNTILISVIICAFYFYRFPLAYDKNKINKNIIISINIVTVYFIIQILPLPALFVKFISPQSYDLYNSLYRPPQWMTISLNPLLSLKYVFSFILGFFLVYIIPHLISSKAELRTFLITIILIGFIQVVFGLLVYFFELNQIGFYDKQFYLNSVTGFFINRNNFSFFCVIMFIITIYFYNFTSKYFYFSKSKSLLNFLMSDLLLIRLILVIFAVTIILTKSRAGNLTFFISLFIMLFLDFRVNRKWTFFSKTILTVLIIDIFFISYYLGSEGLFERISVTTLEGEKSRWEIFSYGLTKFYEFPIFGYSLGNFSTLFRIDLYQGGLFYDHVHNDFIEFMGEIGAVGSFLLFFLFYAYRSQYLINKKSQKVLSDIRQMIIVVIVATIVHGSFDFALHIPSNMLLIFIVLGIGLTQLSRSANK